MALQFLNDGYFAGKVGIGTESPDRKLHVNSGSTNIVATFESTDATAAISLQDNSTTNDSKVQIRAIGDDFNIVAGGSQRVTVNSSGNVGIGKTSPSSKLHIKQSVDNIDGGLTWESVDGTQEWSIDANNAGNFRIYKGTTAIARFDSSGNFGIGTTSPSQKLHVAGNLRVEGAYYDSNNSPGTANQVLISTVTGTDWVDGSAIPGVPAGSGAAGQVTVWSGTDVITGYTRFKVYDAGGQIQITDGTRDIRINSGYAGSTAMIGTSSSHDLGFMTGNSQRVTIDTSGNVGIGTTTPDSKLQIMNNDGSSYRFGYGGSSDVYLDADNVYIRTDNGGANTATFTTTGLGIGTTSPQSTLHVDGDIRRELDGTSTIGFGSGSTSAWYSGIKTVDFGAQNVGLTLFTTTNAGTTNVDALTIDEDGNVGIGTTSPDSLLHVSADVTGANTGTITIEGRPTGFLGDDIATIDFHNNGNKRADIRMERGNTANDSQLVFSTSDTGTLNDALIINEIGNVGIGVTGPQSKLQVAGGIQMADDTDTASAAKVGTMRYRTGTEYVEVTGTELITNGDFASSSNWSVTGGWTISGGKANYATAVTSYLVQTGITLTSGVVYRVRFNISGSSGNGAFIWIGNQAGNVNYLGASYKYYADGDFEEIFTMPSNQTAIAFYSQVASSNFSMDNVTLMEVTEEDASYADMCMQTGSSTYEWVNIVRNTY